MGDLPSATAVRAPGRRGGLRRSARRTNLGLLAMLVVAFVTGWVAFAAGGPVASTVTTVVHGLFGTAVVALLPWKAMIIWRASAVRVASLGLLVIIVCCLLAGFVEVFAGFVIVFGVSPIQVHVGAAVIAVPLVAWHVLRHRPQRPRRTDLARRALLQDASLATGVAMTYGLVVAAALFTRPERPRAATGSRPATLDSTAGSVPATTWLFDRVPALSYGEHRVTIAGVPVPIGELVGRTEVVRARLDCTNGWYGDLDWDAVRLADLVPADRLTGAASLRVRSVTGYERRFGVEEADRLWLAVGSAGRALTPGHGAPVRLVAPGRRGFWWVKWVAAVELSDQPSWAQPPFPLQ